MVFLNYFYFSKIVFKESTMKRIAIFNIPASQGHMLCLCFVFFVKKKKNICPVSFLRFTETLPSFQCGLQCFI